MKFSKKYGAAAALILLILLLGAIGRSWRGNPGNERVSIRARDVNYPRSTQPDPARERETRDATSRARIMGEWKDLMGWLDSAPRPSEKEIQERLLAIRSEWVAMDPQVLAEMLRQLLASGADKATGLPFKVGPHGMLRGWPTLRVFLLDALATSDPEMAIQIARDLLDTTASADEFAVALRSLTRQGMGRASDGELLSRFGQMLGNDHWRGTAGFAEAFDLARFIGSQAAARQLSDWNGDPSLRAMAMNEFAAEHPREVIEAIKDETRPNDISRAILMARADPADSKQRAAIDAYLRSPDRSAEEAVAFLKAYPLRSTTTGFRLYGKIPAPYHHDRIVAGDRAALSLVNQWAVDPQLEKYRPELLSLQQRLSIWTEETQ